MAKKKVRQAVHFEQPAQEATLLDYIHEVDHVAGRIDRLECAIDEAVKTAPLHMRAVIEALQALRGIALVSAVTIVAEVGELSRFERAPQLMGYSGMGAREDSSGVRTRGGITKTGNAHLRRIVIEAAWAKRRPAVVVSPDSFNDNFEDVVLVALTSQLGGERQIEIVS